MITVPVPALPSLTAVTVTYPGLTAVTSPAPETRAIVLSVEVQVTGRPASTVPRPSLMTAVSCAVLPTATAAGDGVTATEATTTAVGVAGGTVGEPCLPRPNTSQAAAPRTTSPATGPTRRMALPRRAAENGGGMAGAGEGSLRAGFGAVTEPVGRRGAGLRVGADGRVGDGEVGAGVVADRDGGCGVSMDVGDCATGSDFGGGEMGSSGATGRAGGGPGATCGGAGVFASGAVGIGVVGADEATGGGVEVRGTGLSGV